MRECLIYRSWRTLLCSGSTVTANNRISWWVEKSNQSDNDAKRSELKRSLSQLVILIQNSSKGPRSIYDPGSWDKEKWQVGRNRSRSMAGVARLWGAMFCKDGHTRESCNGCYALLFAWEMNSLQQEVNNFILAPNPGCKNVLFVFKKQNEPLAAF